MLNKKFLTIALILIFVLSFSSLALACDDEVLYSKIEVQGPTEITVGEFDFADYTVVLTKTDDTTEQIALTEQMISSSDLEKLQTVGEHTITITYNNLTATFSIKVNAKPVVIISISVSGPTEINVGEFDLADYTVVLTKTDDTTEQIALTEQMLSSEDLAKLQTVGEHTITVIYNNLTATFNIKVNAKSVVIDSISVSGPTEITVGEFDFADYTVVLTKTDNTTEQIALTEQMISSSDLAKLQTVGEHTITVTYNNLTATLSIKVKAKPVVIESISVSGPTEIIVGEFDFADYTVVLTKTDDTTEQIALTEQMISSEDLAKLSTVGEHTITVKINNISCSFDIKVKEIVSDCVYILSEDGTYYIVEDYIGTASSINIPALYKNIPVREIGERAFSGQSNISTIILPYSIRKIGYLAFGMCDSLTSITIPVGTIEIADLAFMSCDLLNIYCEAAIQPEGWGDLWNYENRPVTWGYRNKKDNSQFDYIEKEDGIYLTRYKESGNAVVVPDTINGKNVVSFGNIFSNSASLVSVEIGKNILNIDNYAFYQCKNLQSVKMNEALTGIGDNAFSGCQSLNSLNIGKNIADIGEDAFYYCRSLKSIDVDPDNSYYKSIEGNLYNKDATKLLQYTAKEQQTVFTVPAGVKEIEKRTFSFCFNLKEVILPDGLTKIGAGAFMYCSNLTTVNLPQGVETIEAETFNACNNLKNIIIPDSVTSIGDNAFLQCKSLENIVFPDGLLSIGESAFGICDNIKSVYIPASVTEIGNSAFYWCDNLENITVEDDNAYFISIDGNLYSKDGTKLLQYAIGKEQNSFTVPESVNQISYRAFYNSQNLASVTIGKGVEKIESWAFYGCYQLTIYCEAVAKPKDWSLEWNESSLPVVWDCKNNDIADDGYIYTMVNNVRYSLKDGKAGVVFQPVNLTTAVIVPEIEYKGTVYIVDYIADNAFKNNMMTSILIHDSVSSIGNRAFEWCKNLISIDIPEGITELSDYMFKGCSSLTKITLPLSLKHIGDEIFYFCNNVTGVYYKGAEQDWQAVSVGQNNLNFEKATIYFYSESQPVTDGNYWHYVDGVPTVWVYEGVEQPATQGLNFELSQDGTYYVVTGYEGTDEIVDIPSSLNGIAVKEIGERAFENNNTITTVNIPDSINKIGTFTFNGCLNLTTLNVDENNETFKSIDGNIYNKQGTSLLKYAVGKQATSFAIPEGVTYLGDGVFAGNKTLTTITVPDSVTDMGAFTFAYCFSLESISLPQGLTSIGSEAFVACYELTSIVIPQSVVSIKQQAFTYCTNLTIVYYAGEQQQWQAIEIGESDGSLEQATVYYYSESEPALNTDGTAYEGNYWRYVDGVPTVWIKQ